MDRRPAMNKCAYWLGKKGEKQFDTIISERPWLFRMI